MNEEPIRCATHGESPSYAGGWMSNSVQTGESAFENLYGMQIFDYLQQNPESAQIFDRAMTSYSSTEIPAIIASYDFSSIKTLVDVAGGVGSMLLAILQANPHLQGILFDLPTVIEDARSILAASPVGNPCRLETGDFFKSIPQGGDAYILKHIIHDWDDDRAISILQTCRAAMSEDNKLLIVEQVIPPGNEPFIGKLLDLNMLVMCRGGCERTEAEYRNLLERADFKPTKIIPTQSFISIIEAIPQT